MIISIITHFPGFDNLFLHFRYFSDNFHVHLHDFRRPRRCAAQRQKRKEPRVLSRRAAPVGGGELIGRGDYFFAAFFLPPMPAMSSRSTTSAMAVRPISVHWAMFSAICHHGVMETILVFGLTPSMPRECSTV